MQASVYCNSKWAIEGLSKSIAKEVPNGMTIVTLDPCVINTDMCAYYLGHLASQYQSPHEWYVYKYFYLFLNHNMLFKEKKMKVLLMGINVFVLELSKQLQ